VAESFAEIFFGNSTTLGMPCVVMARQDVRALAGLVEEDPALLVTLDLMENKVTAADMDFRGALPDHAREALVRGKWDAIADLLENIPDVQRIAGTLPYFKTA
jgi:3-isopropylmalate/(R)-2-methylmalate dehydratase small subunit